MQESKVHPSRYPPILLTILIFMSKPKPKFSFDSVNNVRDWASCINLCDSIIRQYKVYFKILKSKLLQNIEKQIILKYMYFNTKSIYSYNQNLVPQQKWSLMFFCYDQKMYEEYHSNYLMKKNQKL